jgi:hypothetical protein
MAGAQGNRFFPDGMAVELGMVPIQAVPTTGTQQVFWSMFDDFFSYIEVDAN